MKMKLSKVAILAIRGHKDMKKQIAKATGASEPTVYRWLADNDDNLTKAVVLEIIRKETGLPDDQILVSEEEEKATNVASVPR
jgi:transposase